MNQQTKQRIEALIKQHRLPASFLVQVETWYVPLADDVIATASGRNSPLLVGIQGCQGSGKSTLADFLQLLLQEEAGLRSCVLSMDDVYHTLATRQALAENTHPLFITRGVPGTHDIPLALRTVNALLQADENSSNLIPRFNKATDDRLPESGWETVQGKPDVIILEGWCLAASPMPEESLNEPVNELEAEEDPQGIWRGAINSALSGPYPELHALIDYLVVMTAPDFDCVLKWRSLQEQKLLERLLDAQDIEASSVQSPQQLRRFVQHFQRLTQHCSSTLPDNANFLYQLNSSQQIVSGGPQGREA